MDKSELIDAVRALYLAGEVEATNVYGRLEHVASGAEIDILIREWEQVAQLARELQAQGGSDAP